MLYIDTDYLRDKLLIGDPHSSRQGPMYYASITFDSLRRVFPNFARALPRDGRRFQSLLRLYNSPEHQPNQIWVRPYDLDDVLSTPVPIGYMKANGFTYNTDVHILSLQHTIRDRGRETPGFLPPADHGFPAPLPLGTFLNKNGSRYAAWLYRLHTPERLFRFPATLQTVEQPGQRHALIKTVDTYGENTLHHVATLTHEQLLTYALEPTSIALPLIAENEPYKDAILTAYGSIAEHLPRPKSLADINDALLNHIIEGTP